MLPPGYTLTFLLLEVAGSIIYNASMKASLTIAADVEQLTQVREFVYDFARHYCVEEDWLYDLILAVDEAVTNIIQHGYEQTGGLILVQIETLSDGLQVVIYDTAPSFDPTTYPDPELTAELEERKPGGIGIYMMRKLTDKVFYCCQPDGINELQLVKKFPLRTRPAQKQE
jgi:serine/threonine-protein kinase RsbW